MASKLLDGDIFEEIRLQPLLRKTRSLPRNTSYHYLYFPTNFKQVSNNIKYLSEGGVSRVELKALRMQNYRLIGIVVVVV